jgi:hypothetical protein
MDTDENGVIDYLDFDAATQRACVLAGVAPGTAPWREVIKTANRTWHDLVAELNTDGAAESITLEEFTAAVENPGFIDKVVIPYELGLLSLFDAEPRSSAGCGHGVPCAAGTAVVRASATAARTGALA